MKKWKPGDVCYVFSDGLKKCVITKIQRTEKIKPKYAYVKKQDGFEDWDYVGIIKDSHYKNTTITLEWVADGESCFELYSFADLHVSPKAFRKSIPV